MQGSEGQGELQSVYVTFIIPSPSLTSHVTSHYVICHGHKKPINCQSIPTKPAKRPTLNRELWTLSLSPLSSCQGRFNILFSNFTSFYMCKSLSFPSFSLACLFRPLDNIGSGMFAITRRRETQIKKIKTLLENDSCGLYQRLTSTLCSCYGDMPQELLPPSQNILTH